MGAPGPQGTTHAPQGTAHARGCGSPAHSGDSSTGRMPERCVLPKTPTLLSVVYAWPGLYPVGICAYDVGRGRERVPKGGLAPRS